MTMERTPLRLFGMALLTLALTGCAQVIGIEDFTVDEGAGNASGSGGATGSSTSGSSSSGQPVDICEAVHGCVYGTAEPQTGLIEVFITFNATGYSPRCAIVDDGTTVIFKSVTTNFNKIPLSGGVFPDVDEFSPLKSPTDGTKTEESFVLSGECAYPYFSTGNGQTGVIFISKTP